MVSTVRGRRLLAWTLLVISAATVTSAASPIEETPGVVAWYSIDSLHQKMRNGEAVATWNDSSGNGHHLTSDETGTQAVFEVLQIAGKPALRVGRANTYSVADPFILENHTIFLVYAASATTCALFQSNIGSQGGYGVILRDDGKHDYYKHGQQSASYNRDIQLGGNFSLTMLGREAGIMRSTVNGADLSSNAVFEPKIRVGRFFRVDLSTAVRSEGLGLRISEVIFFDRYLTDDERERITEHLAHKYEIVLARRTKMEPRPPKAERVRASLSTATSLNINDPTGMLISWSIQQKLEEPFTHDIEGENTRLVATRDGSRVRLFISLPLLTSVPDTAVRFFVLKNGDEYLPETGESGRLSGAGKAEVVRIVFEANLELDAGDYIEIVAQSDGVEGDVKLEPSSARLVAEVE